MKKKVTKKAYIENIIVCPAISNHEELTWIWGNKKNRKPGTIRKYNHEYGFRDLENSRFYDIEILLSKETILNDLILEIRVKHF